MSFLQGEINKKSFEKSANISRVIWTIETIGNIYRDLSEGRLSKAETKELSKINNYRRKVINSVSYVKLEARLYKNDRQGERPGSSFPGEIPTGVREMRLNEWAMRSSIPHIYGAFLFLLISRIKFARVLELGTGLGISTLYLLQAIRKTKGCFIDTIESWPLVIKEHNRVFAPFNRDKYQVINGQIERVLPNLMYKIPKYDFVFDDANHQYEPVKRDIKMIMESLPENGLVALDDINWSSQMTKAWKDVSKLQNVVYAASISFSNDANARMGLLLKR